MSSGKFGVFLACDAGWLEVGGDGSVDLSCDVGFEAADDLSSGAGGDDPRESGKSPESTEQRCADVHHDGGQVDGQMTGWPSGRLWPVANDAR